MAGNVLTSREVYREVVDIDGGGMLLEVTGNGGEPVVAVEGP